MAIDAALIAESRKELNDPVFREIFEKHLNLLKGESTGIAEVGKALQLRYRGDFYGLLKEHKREYSHWWIILRLNGMAHPSEYQGGATYRIPELGYITSLIGNWNNTYTV